MKNIGNANDLIGTKDRILYRLFEVFPGFISWVTLLSLIFLSRFKPVWIALFIIVFDLYWLYKIIYFSIHLIISYFHLKQTVMVDWSKKCSNDYYHLIILPTYKEDIGVLETTFQALVESRYPKNKMIVVLAMEQRAGKERFVKANCIEKEFGDKFAKFLITHHPADIKGEIAGKGSNEAWAGKKAKHILDKMGIAYDKVICSVFDIDTCAHPQYFARLTYVFEHQKNPHMASYQPIPMYHNNVWDSSALMRVISSSNSFWQMMQQERPNKLCTFSSHSMSFKTIVDVGFWQNNIVSEDSRIFFQCLFHFKGDYRVVPLFIPVYMDAVLASTYWQSIKNQYKQQRRWGWGCENIPWVLYNSLKTRNMPLLIKLRYSWDQIEGFYSWAVVSLLIFMLGWLPVFIGGNKFNQTVLAFNLPQLTSRIMGFAMFGSLILALINLLLFPKRPLRYNRSKWFWMVLQWLLTPVTMIIFGSIPALDAQTRLMFGKYMGFFVTPKERK